MQKILLILGLMFGTNLMAQDSSISKSNWSFNGYLSSLESIQFDKLNSTNTSGHLLHNRLNVKWKPLQNIHLAGELRNRFLWGSRL